MPEPLYVPDEALRALFTFFMDYETDEEARADVRAVAAPVVAADYRRLADQWEEAHAAFDDVIEALRARADELDPN